MKRTGLVVALIVCIAIIGAITYSSIVATSRSESTAAAKQQPVMTKDGEPYFSDNETLEKDANGEPVLVVKWAIGTRENVRRLRIPNQFVEFRGGCIFLGRVDGNCREPYSTTLLLRAMLPDFTAVPSRKLTKEEDAKVVHFFLTSAFYTPRMDLATRMPLVEALSSIRNLVSRPTPDKRGVVEKPSDFQLRRVGMPDEAIRDYLKRPHSGLYVEEYLFPDRRQPSESKSSQCTPFNPPDDLFGDVKDADGKNICSEWLRASPFFVCMANIFPYPPESGWQSNLVPSCQAFHFDDGLSALVKLRYGRQHLHRWLAIEDDAAAFLHSFLR